MSPSSEKGRCKMTDNEGESSDHDEEVTADHTIRGAAGLVTVSCPRQYPRNPKDRKRLGIMIPEDYTKKEFINNFRRQINVKTNRTLLKAYCVDEPHKRFRKSKNKRERHKHLAFLMDAPFAHKKLAEDFQKQYGLRISFSFRLKGFLSNVTYLREAGKKPSTDVDKDPAVYPPSLDVCKEMESVASNHLLSANQLSKGGNKRKTLNFNEVSNIVIEGVGDGPLRSAAALEEAAKRLKHEGSVELWNYVGGLKHTADAGKLVTKIWHLQGEIQHEMFRSRASYPLEEFVYKDLREAMEWFESKSDSHALVLSGDGGLGKTNLAEALLIAKCPAGFWFLDDPDDFREIEGLIRPEHGLLVDEVTLQALSPNQIKKLFDLEKFRRVKCRHFNASIPAHCRRIFCTNADKVDFYPPMKDKKDRTGVFRRQLFQTISSDLRLPCIKSKRPAALAETIVKLNWKVFLQQVCAEAAVEHCLDGMAAAAEDLGVVLASEVVDVAKDLAAAVGMKRLEQIRFLAAVLSVPPFEAALPRESSIVQVAAMGHDAARDDDPFGHSGSGFDD